MPANNIERAASALRAMAAAYPETHEDFPWGEVAVKAANNKVFLFLHTSAEALSLSCKLPISSEGALLLPFAKPTGYGLGKSGWVSASFGPEDEAPLDMLREWIDESYRAVAPKKLVAGLPGRSAGETREGAKAGAAGAKKGVKVGAKKAAKAAGAKATTKATKAAGAKKVTRAAARR